MQKRVEKNTELSVAALRKCYRRCSTGRAANGSLVHHAAPTLITFGAASEALNNRLEAESARDAEIQNVIAPVTTLTSLSLPVFNLHCISSFQSSSWRSFVVLYGDISTSGSLPTCIRPANR